MQRKKRSIIWSIDKSQLKYIVKNSKSISEILKHFKLNNKGNNYKTLKNRLKHEEIDYSHIKLGLNANKGKKFPTKAIELKIYLTENSTYNRISLKKRLLKENLLKNKCYECELKPEWNGKKLILHIDHINGISNDNRIENLRMLCPNCHSQTETYSGRNARRVKEKEKRVKKNIIKKQRKTKISWPPNEVLAKLLWEKSTIQIGKELGVSDKAVEKRAKKYRISKPPRGYWAKLISNR